MAKIKISDEDERNNDNINDMMVMLVWFLSSMAYQTSWVI